MYGVCENKIKERKEEGKEREPRQEWESHLFMDNFWQKSTLFASERDSLSPDYPDRLDHAALANDRPLFVILNAN